MRLLFEYTYMNQPDCGIVIPTLGNRTDYLMACIESIRSAGYTYICVVSPDRKLGKNLLDAGFVEQFVHQSGTGIANAINVAFDHLPDHIQFQSWLGDDDLLFTTRFPWVWCELSPAE